MSSWCLWTSQYCYLDPATKNQIKLKRLIRRARVRKAEMLQHLRKIRPNLVFKNCLVIPDYRSPRRLAYLWRQRWPPPHQPSSPFWNIFAYFFRSVADFRPSNGKKIFFSKYLWWIYWYWCLKGLSIIIKYENVGSPP